MECSYMTSRGHKCNRRAIHVYDNKLLCGKHLEMTKSCEDCSICYYSLTQGKRIKLKCGHYFHRNCLSQCRGEWCPLCRSPFAPESCIEIYDAQIRSVLTTTFMMNPTATRGFFGRMNNLNNRGIDITQLIQTFNEYIDMAASAPAQQQQQQVPPSPRLASPSPLQLPVQIPVPVPIQISPPGRAQTPGGIVPVQLYMVTPH